MSNCPQLTQGFLMAAYEASGQGTTAAGYDSIALQVLNIKKLARNPTGPDQPAQPDRYRLILSDGNHFMQAMLAVGQNELVTSEELKKNGVIQLKAYNCQAIGPKRVIIILDLSVLTPFQDSVPKQGQPTGLGINGDSSAAPQQPQQNQQLQQPAASTNNMPPSRPQQQQPYVQPKREPQAQQTGYSAYHGQQNQSHNSGYNGGQQYGQNKSNASVSSYGGGGIGNMPSKSGGDAPSAIFPIKSLSPYQNKWTIKARMVSKSDVRTWDNARGQGRLFSCTFVDESGEIRATGFNDAVNTHYDVLKEGKVYYVSKAPIKIAKKQFSNVQNEYEMTLEPQTSITECPDTKDVPGVRYNFIPLDKLSEIEPNTVIDVIGVVKDVGSLSELVSKTTQKPFKKRDLTIVDRSQFEVRMTIWGQNAETFEAQDNPVVAVKGVKLGDFGGRSLSCLGTSSLAQNPDIPEAHHLRGWYDAEGRTGSSYATYTSGGGGGQNDPFKVISDIQNQQLGMNEKPDYFKIRGTVMFVRSENNISYPACPSATCNKKVTDTTNGWRCEKCDKTYPAPQHRYLMSFSIADFTGSQWVQGFNEIGEQLLGKTADEMVAMRESGNQSEYEAVFKAAAFKTCTFKVRAKAETYQDEVKVRVNVMSFTPMDWAATAAEMAATVEQLKAM
ncbi:Replication factor A protein 1 [Geranomyces michiganensis]|nr:Replication factor A protein 1 [Geranomyces michiganensis]